METGLTDKHDLLDRIIALHDDLVDAYDEGYGTEAEQAAWFARMEVRTDEAIDFIERNFNTTMAFRVRNNRSGGYRAFPREEEWRAGWGRWADDPRSAMIWSRIDGVKRVIETSDDYWRVDLDAMRI